MRKRTKASFIRIKKADETISSPNEYLAKRLCMKKKLTIIYHLSFLRQYKAAADHKKDMLFLVKYRVKQPL
jgi:ABC-type transport system involved in cytochrome c biogenesis ATPase subunit